eukprot:TRINITY_DN11795_c0_g1_i1.p1 TRINITY_DN11795_c0_g1~~TRINITY_DN11795_c0_g1_i1.p1  ORF type:complete len:321 (-),score=104.03 TRINITY_DN11795_c0_g1_i1:269-1231(-)
MHFPLIMSPSSIIVALLLIAAGPAEGQSGCLLTLQNADGKVGMGFWSADLSGWQPLGAYPWSSGSIQGLDMELNRTFVIASNEDGGLLATIDLTYGVVSQQAAWNSSVTLYSAYNGSNQLVGITATPVLDYTGNMTSVVVDVSLGLVLSAVPLNGPPGTADPNYGTRYQFVSPAQNQAWGLSWIYSPTSLQMYLATTSLSTGTVQSFVSDLPQKQVWMPVYNPACNCLVDVQPVTGANGCTNAVVTIDPATGNTNTLVNLVSGCTSFTLLATTIDVNGQNFYATANINGNVATYQVSLQKLTIIAQSANNFGSLMWLPFS